MSIERKKDIFEKFEIKINEQDIEELKGVDFANDEVFNKIFSSQQRKAMFKNKKLSEVVRSALNGLKNDGTLSKGCQGNSYRSWGMNGFGIWTHLRGFAFVHNVAKPAIQKVLECNVSSGMIYKPPGSSALFAHVDESMENMLKRTSKCKTVKEWTNEYGYQALCHLNGASSESDGGRTCVLRPLTIKRYKTMLLMIKYEHEDIEKTEKWYKGDRNSVNAGAIEYPWDKILIPELLFPTF